MGARGPRNPRPPGGTRGTRISILRSHGLEAGPFPDPETLLAGCPRHGGACARVSGRKGQRVDFRSLTSPTRVPASPGLRGVRPSGRDRAPPGFGHTRSSPRGREGGGLTPRGPGRRPALLPQRPQLRGPRRRSRARAGVALAPPPRAGLALPPRRPRLRVAAAEPGAERAGCGRPAATAAAASESRVPPRPWYPRRRRAPELRDAVSAQSAPGDPGPAAWGCLEASCCPRAVGEALRARVAPASGQAGDPPPGLRPGGGCRQRGTGWPGTGLGPGRQRSSRRGGGGVGGGGGARPGAWAAGAGRRAGRMRAAVPGSSAFVSAGPLHMEMTLELVPIRVLLKDARPEPRSRLRSIVRLLEP